MSRICTICVRGGSKGVSGKNGKLLIGKPLLAYSIEQAKQSGLFDVVAVSSDSDELLTIALAAGSDYAIKRPEALATDQAAKLPAIQHCFAEVERLTGRTFDIAVDLDATSPLRDVADIQGAVALLESEATIPNVITAMPARRSPYFNQIELTGEGFVRLCKELPQSIVRRQDAPKCYDMNASIYVWRRAVLLHETKVLLPETRLFEMPEERSIDIDSPLDFDMVEFLMRRKVEM